MAAIDLKDLGPISDRATCIANLYDSWKKARSGWEQEKAEIRNYVFARDTTTTTNSKLPWKNKTTRPKLCQIRDNLHANYMAALFPREDWFRWEGDTAESVTAKKARAITAYMSSKLRTEFINTVSDLVYDYIDFGQPFAEVEYVSDLHTLPDGQTVRKFVGPRLRRISPFDHVFDITAPKYEEAGKITRRLYTMGDLKNLERLGVVWAKAAFAAANDIRTRYAELGNPDIKKYEGFALEGLGSITDYLKNQMVEVLEYDGDLYTKGQLETNRHLVVVDRRVVVHDEPALSWLGRSNKHTVGWRPRPDSLLAMGPLDNLIGLQYRLDHLENIKSDVYDQIAHPVVFEQGMVEEWEWGPGERIYGDAEARVDILRPDYQAVTSAEMQIADIERAMEEYAGAPREAMGIRTPGEKTAYEVQSLQNGAGRMFQAKITHFERVFLEPVLNDMLEASRRNMGAAERIGTPDDAGAIEFLTITPDDIKASGKLVPFGARHYADIALKVQNINAFVSSPVYADPSIKAHFSALKLAEQIGELLRLEEGTVREGVRIEEDAKLAQLAQAGQATVQDNAAAGVLASQAQQQLEDEQITSGAA